MDRPITLPWWRKPGRIRAASLLALLAIAIALGASLLGGTERTLRVERQRLAIATVELKPFLDFIPLRGRVVPLETIYLDALEGGRIEQVLVQPGDYVTAGQPLVELSNTELELTVLDREARLIESITQLQTYQTQLEQNHLDNEKALALIDYNVVRLNRSVQRRRALAARGIEAKEANDVIEDELAYSNALRPLQIRSNERQEALRVQQLPQIGSQLEKLRKDVEITRSKLNNLVVRAPVAGRMTAIDLKVGETRNRGEHFGELTPDTGYKLSADIDEYYLGRLHKGQRATVQVGAVEPELRVARIYPQVKDGTFVVDFSFSAKAPGGLLPGQTLQGKVVLGDPVNALVLPSGAYLDLTGGNWIFVLDGDARTAHRRNIKVGRRSTEQVEVLSGLRSGEHAITSDYTAYERIERIDLE